MAKRGISIGQITVALALLVLAGFGTPLSSMAQPLASVTASATTPARLLAQAKSWGYQLQKIDPDALADAPYDVLVIDYSRDGTQEGALTAEEIARLKRKPDGSPRIVLAYLSIGEAESYRYYWDQAWSADPPDWLGEENKKWRGNLGVKYWDPEWQNIIFAGGNSYLARIIKVGFDGVYLDKVDQFLDAEKDTPDARALMVELVAALAQRARALKPGFLIVPQNAEELLADARYRALIDGLGKEDLLFGESRSKRPNKPEDIENHVGFLNLLTADGKPVFAVEYLDSPEDIEYARRALEGHGFVPHFAKRSLDRMRIGDLPEPPQRRSKR